MSLKLDRTQLVTDGGPEDAKGRRIGEGGRGTDAPRGLFVPMDCAARAERFCNVGRDFIHTRGAYGWVGGKRDKSWKKGEGGKVY